MASTGRALNQQLAAYKQCIDEDIAAYAAHVRQSTRQQYGEYSALVTEGFLDMLERGGKRLRGALVMVGYEMLGGTDQAMIVRAATAIEMVHAHLLILDDIQDRSAVRRGKATVHELLAEWCQQSNLTVDDPAHLGMSLALNALFGGNAAAQSLLASLSVPAEYKINVLGIVNHTINVTAHGQTQDLVAEVKPTVTYEDLEHIMEWKTATYTVLNPLCVGMVLAGAPCADTDAIRDYALHTGKAFQITDDIIGTFGTDAETGKSVLDDMREGKQTLLTVYGLEHASKAEQVFLRQCLGNRQLSLKDFRHCQDILRQCGALDYATQAAQEHVGQALLALEKAPSHWQPTQVTLLKQLTKSLLFRTQ